MSDPTRPDETNPETPIDERTVAPSSTATPEESAGGGQTSERMKAQAYVDPSFAAEAQLAAAEAEAADWKDKYIRAQAEMDNLRKRTEREKADTSKYAISRFAGDMLAVADNLQRALAAFGQSGSEPDPHTKTLVEGIELTESELSKALDRHGVRRIDALGVIFDPNYHQAVMEEENKDVTAGTVMRVFQEGYQIG
ncbi:MAG: nucleotide exchange factor GrpE, partial [Alphaproteobacteria bacterium]|nr:nucleotide exchange factor GrpE [Alphaproteobacteria bacterium]